VLDVLVDIWLRAIYGSAEPPSPAAPAAR